VSLACYLHLNHGANRREIALYRVFTPGTFAVRPYLLISARLSCQLQLRMNYTLKNLFNPSSAASRSPEKRVKNFYQTVQFFPFKGWHRAGHNQNQGEIQ